MLAVDLKELYQVLTVPSDLKMYCAQYPSFESGPRPWGSAWQILESINGLCLGAMHPNEPREPRLPYNQISLLRYLQLIQTLSQNMSLLPERGIFKTMIMVISWGWVSM